MSTFIEDIENVIDSHFPCGKIISIPINKLFFRHLCIRGIYILYSNKDIIYIGCSGGIGNRLRSHCSLNSPYSDEIMRIKIIRIENGKELLIVEAQLIEQFKPIYNKTNRNFENVLWLNNFDINKIISQIKLGMDK